FPLGATTVTWTVTDRSGNSNTATQIVTVLDTQNPTIATLAATSVNADAGVCTYASSQLTKPSAADNCSVIVTASPASLTLGSNTVTWTATDGSGNTATSTQTVTVVDIQMPTIAVSTVLVSANASCSATGVDLGTPTTTDNCSVALVANDAPAIFELGNTTVIWTVTDGSGNTATANQTVTVVDDQNPTVETLADISLNADAGICSYASSQLTAPTAADNCSVASVVVSPASLALGSNLVTWTVTDGSGNVTTSTQNVTILDVINPVITCLENIDVYTDASSCGAIVSYALPVVTDNCNSNAASNLISNGSFESGFSNWTINDGTGTSGCNQPWIATTTGSMCNSVASPIDGTNAAYTAFDGSGPTAYTMSQQITIPSGFSAANLNWLETYSMNYSNTQRTFSIDLYDATNTVLIANLNSQALPFNGNIPWTPFSTDVTSVITSQIGNTVTLRVSAIVPQTLTGPGAFGFDNVSLDITGGGVQLEQTAGLASGSLFPIGTTTNTFLATDGSGNTSTCSFDVIVTDNEKPNVL
ncbi:MAG: HYR domain-containing protein, partial [Thermodesulfovibrionia bacterium]|nr:HYR domain-containing protein [Thermodesulfovibrionia bacterium]